MALANEEFIFQIDSASPFFLVHLGVLFLFTESLSDVNFLFLYASKVSRLHSSHKLT